MGLSLLNTCLAKDSTNKSLELLFVGWLTPPKGIDVLIRACEILRGKGVDFLLNIIGDGLLKEDLQNMVHQIGLSQQIRFLGTIPRKALGHYYQQADIVCVPSLNDPLPTVVLESLISGTPVIGSNVGGIPFMVQSGVNGIIVPPNDAKALAESIELMRYEPEKMSILKKNSRLTVLTKFSWEFVGTEIQKHIEKIVKNTS